jgi:metallo-beta-lactamase family protein
MHITFHGAAQTVTGSQHLLEVNGKRILLDCGLYQGKRDESRQRNENLPFPPADVDVMVLSHGHIDHSGNIPNLVKRGYTGRIICTSATADLCTSMLADSGHIQESDVEYVNRKRQKHGQPPVQPIYTQQDALNSLKQFQAIDYEKPTELLPGVTLTLFDAGHMLGSEIVILDFADDGGRQRRLVFSGDLGRPNVPILRDPTFIDRADILIMESTYGGKTHPPITESAADMLTVIKRTVDRGGKVIIPAFAVERTQMLVYLLNDLANHGTLPDVPIYVDSPLAVNVTEIFRKHPEDFDDETRAALSKDPDGDVFGFRRLTYIRDVEESKKLNDLREPCVIISASGMAEAGRIQHHLKNNVENPKNTILFAGFQAPNTLGRQLVDHASVVHIFGEDYHPKAEITSLQGFSGHADHPGLLAWVKAFQGRPEQIFLVHGEIEPAETLSAALRKDLGFEKVTIPAMHQSFDV